MITPYHAKLFAHEISKRHSVADAEKLAGTLLDAHALNAIIGLDGLDIEICGAWVWVDGETYRHRAPLKQAGFRFASKKKRWYFRPENWRSSSRGQYLSLNTFSGPTSRPPVS